MQKMFSKSLRTKKTKYLRLREILKKDKVAEFSWQRYFSQKYQRLFRMIFLFLSSKFHFFYEFLLTKLKQNKKT